MENFAAADTLANRYVWRVVKVTCSCGLTASIDTSWTDSNPGREFYNCPGNGRHCGFLAWAGPPMCERSIEIIPELLRTIKNHEARERRGAIQKQRLKIDIKIALDQNHKLKIALGLSWFFFFWYFLRN